MGACVSLQIERVIESFATERAQIAFDVRMALHVPIQQSLQRERFRADVAGELVRIVVSDRCLLVFVGGAGAAATTSAQHMIEGEWVLEAMATVDELQLDFGGKTQL